MWRCLVQNKGGGEGKGFAAEQKIREFKKLLLKMKNLFKKYGKKLKPNEVIQKVTTN